MEKNLEICPECGAMNINVSTFKSNGVNYESLYCEDCGCEQEVTTETTERDS